MNVVIFYDTKFNFSVLLDEKLEARKKMNI